MWVPECVSAVSFNLCTKQQVISTTWYQLKPEATHPLLCHHVLCASIQRPWPPARTHTHARKHTLVSLCSTSCIWTITKAARWSGVRLDLYQLSDWQLPPTGNGLQHEGVLQRLHTLTFTQSRCPKLFFFSLTYTLYYQCFPRGTNTQCRSNPLHLRRSSVECLGAWTNL